MGLRLLVFLGSARDSTPPRPKRLGLRVARACLAQLQAAGHEVTLIDPLDLDLSGPFKPHFAYAQGRAPEGLEALSRQIAAAIARLLEHEALVVQDPDVVAAALAHLQKKPTLGFSDCLILEIARKAGHLPLGTFDRNLGRLDGASRLKG